MLFLLIFIMCGVLLRGLYKSMAAWAGKWKRDSLEFLRISGIACFVTDARNNYRIQTRQGLCRLVSRRGCTHRNDV